MITRDCYVSFGLECMDGKVNSICISASPVSSIGFHFKRKPSSHMQFCVFPLSSMQVLSLKLEYDSKSSYYDDRISILASFETSKIIVALVLVPHSCGNYTSVIAGQTETEKSVASMSNAVTGCSRNFRNTGSFLVCVSWTWEHWFREDFLLTTGKIIGCNIRSNRTCPIAKKWDGLSPLDDYSILIVW